MEPQRPLEAPPYLVPHSSESIRILYADQSLLIVDKPHLLLSVPGRHPLNRDSLISRLQRQFPGVAAAHRLDLDTSGLLVVPRNKTALAHLNRQFQGRNIQKIYQALVHGTVAEEEGKSATSPPTGKIGRSRRSRALRKTVQTKFVLGGIATERWWSYGPSPAARTSYASMMAWASHPGLRYVRPPRGAGGCAPAATARPRLGFSAPENR